MSQTAPPMRAALERWICFSTGEKVNHLSNSNGKALMIHHDCIHPFDHSIIFYPYIQSFVGTITTTSINHPDIVSFWVFVLLV